MRDENIIQAIQAIADAPQCQAQPLLGVWAICQAMNQCEIKGAPSKVAELSHLHPEQSPAAMALDDLERTLLFTSIEQDEMYPVRKAAADLTTHMNAFFREHERKDYKAFCNHIISLIFEYFDPVYFAFLKGDIAALKPLLEQDPQHLQQSFPRYTRAQQQCCSLLMHAVSKSKRELALSLLEMGADAAVADPSTGQTPLHVAAIQGDTPLFSRLDKAAPQAKQQQDHQRITPLCVMVADNFVLPEQYVHNQNHPCLSTHQASEIGEKLTALVDNIDQFDENLGGFFKAFQETFASVAVIPVVEPEQQPEYYRAYEVMIHFCVDPIAAEMTAEEKNKRQQLAWALLFTLDKHTQGYQQLSQHILSAGEHPDYDNLTVISFNQVREVLLHVIKDILEQKISAEIIDMQVQLTTAMALYHIYLTTPMPSMTAFNVLMQSDLFRQGLADYLGTERVILHDALVLDPNANPSQPLVEEHDDEVLHHTASKARADDDDDDDDDFQPAQNIKPQHTAEVWLAQHYANYAATYLDDHTDLQLQQTVVATLSSHLLGLSDAEIAQQASTGNEQALEIVFSKHRQKMAALDDQGKQSYLRKLIEETISPAADKQAGNKLLVKFVIDMVKQQTLTAKDFLELAFLESVTGYSFWQSIAANTPANDEIDFTSAIECYFEKMAEDELAEVCEESPFLGVLFAIATKVKNKTMDHDTCISLLRDCFDRAIRETNADQHGVLSHHIKEMILATICIVLIEHPDIDIMDICADNQKPDRSQSDVTTTAMMPIALTSREKLWHQQVLNVPALMGHVIDDNSAYLTTFEAFILYYRLFKMVLALSTSQQTLDNNPQDCVTHFKLLLVNGGSGQIGQAREYLINAMADPLVAKSPAPYQTMLKLFSAYDSGDLGFARKLFGLYLNAAANSQDKPSQQFAKVMQIYFSRSKDGMHQMINLHLADDIAFFISRGFNFNMRVKNKTPLDQLLSQDVPNAKVLAVLVTANAECSLNVIFDKLCQLDSRQARKAYMSPLENVFKKLLPQFTDALVKYHDKNRSKQNSTTELIRGAIEDKDSPLYPMYHSFFKNKMLSQQLDKLRKLLPASSNNKTKAKANPLMHRGR